MKACDTGENEEECETFSIDLEHEIFEKAKNLILYQSNLIKKLTELKKFTKDKKAFINEYKSKKIGYEDDKKFNEIEKKFEYKNIETNFGFTSALNILNIRNNNESSCDVVNKEENLDNSVYEIVEEKPDIVEPEIKIEKNVKIEKGFVSSSSLLQVDSQYKKVSAKEQQALILQKISKIVVIELTVYYKNGRFSNKVCRF